MPKFFTFISTVVFICTIHNHAAAQGISAEQLKAMKDAIREMCILPDRAGDQLRVEGEARAGVPIPVKIVKADISGKISYDTWQGIPITLDKYKTDPRQCSLEMLKLLLPNFKPIPEKKINEWRKQESEFAVSGRNVGFSVEAFARGRAVVENNSIRAFFPKIELSHSTSSKTSETYVQNVRACIACTRGDQWKLFEL